jgi:hypothetical protein
MSQEDRDYLLTRAAQERALAEQASDEIVREIHEKLAHAYEVRASGSELTARAANHVYGATSADGQSS